MGKKGSTQVQPVDPWEVGRADATFNRIDSYTPFGNLTYSGPNRNVANLQLNPYLAGNEERRMLSDRMLLDTALGRQQQMNQGGLPSLTSGIQPGAMRDFFGLPTYLQSGFDQAPTPPTPPNVIPGSDTPGGQKGGVQPSMPGQQMPRAKGGGPQPYRPGADMSISPKIQPQPTSAKGGQMGGGQSQGFVAGGPPSGDTDPAQAMARYRANQMRNQMGGSPTGMGLPPGMTLPGGGLNPNYDLGGGRTIGSGGPFGPQQIPQQQSQAPGQKGGGQQQSPFGGSIGEYIDPSRISGDRVEKALYDRQLNLIQPELDQQEQRTVTDLRARGIPRGSEAWDNEIARLDKNRMLQYGNLANQSVLAGGQEQSRQQGIQQGIFGMADQLSQRDIQAQLQNANISSMNRATQFNELASLLGLQQVASPGLNNFFAPGNVDMTGAYGLNQQAQMANARNSASQKGGMLGGLGALGGAAIGAPAGGWFGNMMGKL